MSWWKELKGKVKINQPLKKYTTFKVGGECLYLIEPKDIADLKLLLKLLNRYKISFVLIGNGSNILFGDKNRKLAVIRLGSAHFRRISFQAKYANAGAGCPLSKLINCATARGLGGHEFLAGIPGTVGGAMVMNAGKGRGQPGFADLVENVTLMDYNGLIKVIGPKELKFGYRKSNLKKFIVLSTRIKLFKQDKKIIKNKINEYLAYRKLTQDYTHASAGCVFKNPPGLSAGRLIDLCGLKGKKMGGACISDKHANFMINHGEAKAGDVLKLIALVKRRVKNKFNITLEPEIEIWR